MEIFWGGCADGVWRPVTSLAHVTGELVGPTVGPGAKDFDPLDS